MKHELETLFVSVLSHFHLTLRFYFSLKSQLRGKLSIAFFYKIIIIILGSPGVIITRQKETETKNTPAYVIAWLGNIAFPGGGILNSRKKKI